MLHLSGADFESFVRSPFVDDQLFHGDDRVSVVVVDGPERPIANPGSLPVVVVWVGDEFGGHGPQHADLVVGADDVDDLVAAIAAAPLAATSLAVLLRTTTTTDIDTALGLESAVYSMLQAGPEFAAWRRAHPAHAVNDDEPTVATERDGATLRIALDRPHRHNAISRRLRDDLAEALGLALADDTITAVELRGHGPSFSSGGDLDEFGSHPDPATAHITRLTRSPARLVHRLAAATTVYLHGHALGGGLELAAFAGRVVAHPETAMALPEVALGLIPGAGGTISLPHRIGRQRTAALALAGRTIDAPTALRWGLVDDVSERP